MGCWAPVRKGEGAYIGCYNISLLLWIISFPGVLSTATCVLLSLFLLSFNLSVLFAWASFCSGVRCVWSNKTLDPAVGYEASKR